MSRFNYVWLSTHNDTRVKTGRLAPGTETRDPHPQHPHVCGVALGHARTRPCGVRSRGTRRRGGRATPTLISYITVFERECAYIAHTSTKGKTESAGRTALKGSTSDVGALLSLRGQRQLQGALPFVDSWAKSNATLKSSALNYAPRGSRASPSIS